MKKKEFAYRDASMFLTHVEFFWKSEFENKGHSERFFYPTVFLRFYNFPLKKVLKELKLEVIEKDEMENQDRSL